MTAGDVPVRASRNAGLAGVQAEVEAEYGVTHSHHRVKVGVLVAGSAAALLSLGGVIGNMIANDGGEAQTPDTNRPAVASSLQDAGYNGHGDLLNGSAATPRGAGIDPEPDSEALISKYLRTEMPPDSYTVLSGLGVSRIEYANNVSYILSHMVRTGIISDEDVGAVASAWREGEFPGITDKYVRDGDVGYWSPAKTPRDALKGFIRGEEGEDWEVVRTHHLERTTVYRVRFNVEKVEGLVAVREVAGVLRTDTSLVYGRLFIPSGYTIDPTKFDGFIERGSGPYNRLAASPDVRPFDN